MPPPSAGLMVYRRLPSGAIEVLLAHPGGPWFARKDLGAWTIPKGEYELASEEPLAAAEREFAEEIGLSPPPGERIDLGEVRQTSGKRVRGFAVEGDLDPREGGSNLFEMEWPPGSGKVGRFPEIDRAEWFGLDEARRRLNLAQSAFVDRLAVALGLD